MANNSKHISPEIRAKATLDVVLGQINKSASIQDVADKYGLPKSTIQTWWEDVRPNVSEVVKPPDEHFADVMARVASSVMRAHEAALKPLEDQDWLKDKYSTADGEKKVAELIVTVTTSLITVAKATGQTASPAAALGPGDTEDDEVITPELVDDSDPV